MAKKNLVNKVIDVIDNVIDNLDKKETEEKELEIQTNFNTDGLDELVADGEVEHVYDKNN